MSNPRFGHESPAIAVRTVLAAAAVLVTALVLIVVGLYVFLQYQGRDVQRTQITQPGPVPPAPRLQVNPTADLAVLRAQKQAQLNEYAWVDAAHTIARIPVQRAMQLYVAQHATARPAKKESGP